MFSIYKIRNDGMERERERENEKSCGFMCRHVDGLHCNKRKRRKSRNPSMRACVAPLTFTSKHFDYDY